MGYLWDFGVVDCLKITSWVPGKYEENFSVLETKCLIEKSKKGQI